MYGGIHMSDVKLVKRSEVDQSITWDMTLLYPSDEAYRTTLKETEAQLKSFKEKYEDKLADLEVLTAATEEYEALYETFYRLSHYAELPMTVDRFNDTVVENATLFEQLASAWAQNMSFYDTEIVGLEESLLRQFVEEKRPDLAYFIEKIIRVKAHTLSKDAEQVLSNMSSLPSFYQLYEVTKHEDMEFDSFEADGKTYENSFVLYENLHEMDNHTEVRRNAAKSFYKTLNRYKNTVANEYISTIKKEKMLATMRGYDSVIDYLLDKQDGDRELYDRQIRTLMTDLAPHIQRYIRLLAREHNIQDMQFADCKINLDPEFEEKITGSAIVRETYTVSKLGTIAGSYVTEGVVKRSSQVRLIRDNIVIYEGELASLKRFKDDVKEVKLGFECGIMIEGYNDIKVDDIIEAFEMVEIKRK